MAIALDELKEVKKEVKKPANDGRIKIKVVNLENPGQDIFVGDNGRNYLIQDQQIVSVPISVYNGLMDCVYETAEVEGNKDSGKSIKRKLTSRFFITKISNETEEEENELENLKKNKDID